MTEEQAIALLEQVQLSNQLLTYIAGFCLALVVIVLLHYSYKFLKLFF